jgi:serine/threonine-protein kinase
MANPPDRETLTQGNSLTPERFARVRAVFEAAIERPTAEQRAFAAGACAGDAALLSEVERMLDADVRADRVLADRVLLDNTSSSAPEEGRFPVGTVLAGRYRILGLLGHGGMGEVYKAFDLILNQTVALKFLSPAHISEAALMRFRNEVRIARQVSHPNVCRVYDLGMVEGMHFLSMEYIDGEDLASLLRRIGRLPQDKATEFTRNICAGLSAAHKRGVLHRDLKPTNIMIDGRGQVRITDFGLAGLAVEIPLSDLRSGTPAYMSPEQKAGKEVTTRSDIYSLGLVLHEMFTGKGRKDTQANPTDLVKDLDPAIERLILRCLEEDPKRRPQTALNVVMALPGADPVAAALAAGETPSPEMVAASGPMEGLTPKMALAMLAGIALGLVALCLLAARLRMLGQLPLEYPPEVLAEKAREIAHNIGYTQRAADSAQGLVYDAAHVAYLEKRISGLAAWKQALAYPPSAVSFWYVQSRTKLPPPAIEPGLIGGPPATSLGMISVKLGLDGRLLSFRAVPETEDGTSSQAPDWSKLFAAAYLDPAELTSDNPQSTLAVGADVRAAWRGTFGGPQELPMRVEAATGHGRPIYFEVFWPWTATTRGQDTGNLPPSFRVVIFTAMAAFFAACVVARYNWKTGRSDTRGALRLAVFFTIAWYVSVGLETSFARAGDIGGLLWQALGDAVVLAMIYLAVEPWGRRQWPEAMVTWARVLEGRWRDPAVARDVLFGLAWAIGAGLYMMLRYYVDIRLGSAPTWTSQFFGVPDQPNLASAPMVVSSIIADIRIGVVLPLIALTFIVFLRMLFGRRSIAAITVALLVVFGEAAEASHWVDWLFSAGAVTVFIYAMQRFGLFVSMIYVASLSMIAGSLLTADLTAWYGLSSMLTVVFISALALVASQLSLGGRPLFEVKPG